MKTQSFPQDDQRDLSQEASERIAALHALGILDTEPEKDFDDIVEYLARSFEVPVALVSLVEETRQWFKAETGLGRRETPMNESICFHALCGDDILEISDASLDPRTVANPLVAVDAGVRFYAGAPLRLDGGPAIGTLCVLDYRPRRLNDLQRDLLRLLARQVVRQMQLRRSLGLERQMRGEVDHRVKNSLQMVMSYLRLQRRLASDEAGTALGAAEQRVAAISMLHGALNEAGGARSVDLAAYLGRIAGYIEETLPENIALSLEVAPVRMGANEAAALGQIVNEFVTNSAKYAFPDGRTGKVRIRGLSQGGTYRIVLSDDGVGLSPNAPRGLGLNIIETAAQQLDAELDRTPEGSGARLALTFVPAADEPARPQGNGPSG